MVSTLYLMYHVARIFQQGGGTQGRTGDIVGGVLEVVGIIVGIGLLLMGMFRKAGKPAWTAFIPVVNILVLLNIVGRPWWWIILYLVPIVNAIILIVVCIDLAKSFGRSSIFGIGLIIPVLNVILLLVLSYGSARYIRPMGR